MSFISFEYLLLIVVLVFLLNHISKWRIELILFASIIFYIFSGIEGFFIITSIILINYLMGIYVLKHRDKLKNGTIFLIILNVSILVILKIIGTYFSYFKISIYLPLGVSFIVFTILSYNFEVLKGNILPEKNIIYFATYILYFPKVSQGPIERPMGFLKQIKENAGINYISFVYGLKLICWGLFKKTVIADRASVITNNIFNNPNNYSGLATIIGVILYSIEIYADFSGYIDIAIGSSNLVGINLSKNFNSPYLSKSIKEFWNRWHITLSHWLRDYIFLPISYKMFRVFNKLKFKNKTSELMTYSISTLITFFICGLWHGLTLNFIIWGLIFATYLIFSRITNKFRKKIKKKLKLTNPKLNIIISVTITFLLITFNWIFFRANSLPDAILIIKHIIEGIINIGIIKNVAVVRSIFSGFGLSETEIYILAISILILFVTELFKKGGTIFDIVAKKPIIIRWAVYFIMTFIILFFSFKGSNQNFIYLQF